MLYVVIFYVLQLSPISLGSEFEELFHTVMSKVHHLVFIVLNC